VTETQSAPPALIEAPPAAPSRPLRVGAARIVIGVEACMLFLIAAFYAGHTSVVIPVLCVVGAGFLAYGTVRMGRDPAVAPVQPVGADGFRRVPWDWTDFLLFWPGAFTASTMLVSLFVPLGDQFTKDVDSTVRNAVESFIAQAAFYAGALFNIYVLAFLRRGGNLFDLGWRRFSWWWAPIAIATAWVTVVGAEYLQVFSQRLFPSAQNTQCVAVQHEYGHFLALAVIVVCVIAPLSEETIFRGVVFGWLHRWSPAGVAVPVSAAIFAALHGVLLLFIPLFAVGCVLAVVFHFSKSLVPGALVHALFNLPGIIAILYAASC